MAAELVAVVFGGANTAARQLAGLRTSRDAPWLAKVAVVEHLGRPVRRRSRNRCFAS